MRESEVIQQPPSVAYLSMEMGLEPDMPTYSGGLGVLAGDTLRAAADLGLRMVGLTLLYRLGYFRQHLDARGDQEESPANWSPQDFLEPLTPRVLVHIEGRPVQVRAWRHFVSGIAGHTVPVYLLDTDLAENSRWDRTLTDHLYGGDERYRLAQEAVLGLGGLAMLRALGHTEVHVYHMNEGHAALLALALLEERVRGQDGRSVTTADIEAVQRQCVFTTHTPVPTGHDQFSIDLARQVLGSQLMAILEAADYHYQGVLNTTYLALVLSRYVNGVAMRHREISRRIFPDYPINAITNGVHAATWATVPFQRLYDRHTPEWRRDNLYLRYAVGIPLDEIQAAHDAAQVALLDEVHRRTDVRLDPTVLTLGFARRATAYKRADLLFADLERLERIVHETGPLQIIFAGKAHPRDEAGKDAIRRIFAAAEALKDTLPVVYLEEHEMGLARLLCAGVDVWLNTPQKPLEASGTSGMKAALNGVPSLSVLDGWWIEGHVEGVTGWSIGDGQEEESDAGREAASLYDKLESTVLPLFYKHPSEFAAIMRSAIALNGSFFSAQRMLSQYVANAYLAFAASAEPAKPPENPE